MTDSFNFTGMVPMKLKSYWQNNDSCYSHTMTSDQYNQLQHTRLWQQNDSCQSAAALLRLLLP